MAFLVVGGVTVNAAKDSVKRNITEIGDAARTFDGTWRQNIRNRVSGWQGRTPPLTTAVASSQFAALTSSTQPVECWGDMLGAASSSGATNYFTRAVSEDAVVGGGSTFRFVIAWELQASS